MRRRGGAKEPPQERLRGTEQRAPAAATGRRRRHNAADGATQRTHPTQPKAGDWWRRHMADAHGSREGDTPRS